MSQFLLQTPEYRIKKFLLGNSTNLRKENPGVGTSKIIVANSNSKNEYENLAEEYYQISPQILASFPKFRPPINFYLFKEEIGELEPYFYAGQRLSKEKQAELADLCSQGNIFVARSDRHIYAEHISEQLDLILMDKNLKKGEIADILVNGLQKRMDSFFEQPVKVNLEDLQRDCLVYTEYTWNDPHKIKGLLRRLSPENSLSALALNTLLTGTALYFISQKNGLNKNYFDQLSLALLLTPLGLTKLPKFLREKKNLTLDEQKRLQQHPTKAFESLHNLDIRNEVAGLAVYEHQERLDGSGFPRGLKHRQISFQGRLAALASAFSQQYIEFKQEKSPFQSSEILSKMENKFDSKLINILLGITRRLS